jgi:DNA polymerase III gamma/tau subunit
MLGSLRDESSLGSQLIKNSKRISKTIVSKTGKTLKKSYLVQMLNKNSSRGSAKDVTM